MINKSFYILLISNSTHVLVFPEGRYWIVRHCLNVTYRHISPRYRWILSLHSHRRPRPHWNEKRVTASSSWFAWFFKHQFRSLKIVTHNHLMARIWGQMSYNPTSHKKMTPKLSWGTCTTMKLPKAKQQLGPIHIANMYWMLTMGQGFLGICKFYCI